MREPPPTTKNYSPGGRIARSAEPRSGAPAGSFGSGSRAGQVLRATVELPAPAHRLHQRLAQLAQPVDVARGDAPGGPGAHRRGERRAREALLLGARVE